MRTPDTSRTRIKREPPVNRYSPYLQEPVYTVQVFNHTFLKPCTTFFVSMSSFYDPVHEGFEEVDVPLPVFNTRIHWKLERVPNQTANDHPKWKDSSPEIRESKLYDELMQSYKGGARIWAKNSAKPYSRSRVDLQNLQTV